MKYKAMLKDIVAGACRVVETHREVTAKRGRDAADNELLTIMAQIAMEMEATIDGDFTQHMNACINHWTFSMACIVIDLESAGVTDVAVVRPIQHNDQEPLN